MRIPASLVVMGCVTAVPFGLAIRDTVRHTPRGEELDLTGDATRAREARARAEHEEAKARADYEARLLERDALLDSLFGKTAAQRGTLTESTPEIDVVHDHDVMTLSVPAHLCDRLHERLLAAWGPGANDIWINPSTHDRAAFSDDACSLRFEHVDQPNDWVEHLPFSSLGTHLLGAEWTSPGVGYGREVTRAYAESEQGQVVRINVVGDTDLDTQRTIRDALSAHLKQQPIQSADDPNVWTWQAQPLVRFDASGATRFSIQIGKPQ